MPDVRIPKYFSQFDGDSGGFKGLCAETCLKMADCHYSGREIALVDIVRNGDNDGTITTEAGAIKAARWLGLNPKPGNTFWRDINQNDLKTWLKNGNLIMAFINYGRIPAKYKQDQNFKGIHAILITGITDDGKSVRYADPLFWGARREEGWMDNNKWITWDELSIAWSTSYKPFAGLQFDMKKPEPPTNNCEVDLANARAEIDRLNKDVIPAYRTDLDNARREIDRLNRDVIQKTKNDLQTIVNQL